MLRRPGLVFAALAAVFWWVLIIILPPDLQIELLRAAFLPLSGIALWRWGPGAMRGIVASQITPSQILTIAVATMAFAAAFQSVYSLMFRWLGRPEAMTQSPWAGFSVYVFTISLVLYLLSTKRESDPPMPTLLLVVTISALAILLAGALIRFLI